MSTHSPDRRTALRTFVVVALSLIVIAATGLQLREIWARWGDFGYGTNGDNAVIFIADGSPAAKAGMEVGDAIDLQSTPAQFRYFVSVAEGTLRPGQRATFGLTHKGVRRLVTLTSIPGVRGHLFATYRFAVFGVAVLYVVLGGALVLLRPSLMTWGFFFYCLYGPGVFGMAELLSPYPWSWLVTGVFDGLLAVAGTVGLLVFALCFLSEPLKGWRLSAVRLMPWLFVALSLFYLFYFYQVGWIGGPPGELLTRIYFVLEALWSLAALYMFLDTYVHARGADRQRIRWIVVAFALNLVLWFVKGLLQTYVPGTPNWVVYVLALSTVIVPLAVTYAVIKHRVIDVSFVVSRALVYGVLTTLLVGVFSIIDWFFTDYLRLARLGTIAEVGAVVAFGLWFNGLHKRVDTFIDATFFRQRHKAEVQLARDAAALPLATTTGAIAHFLVSEPMQAMSLASAALFRRGRDGVFMREESEGWSAGDLSRLDDVDEPLLMLAQSEGGPLSLYDHRWRTDGLPAGPGRPVLALPIIVRRELTAIVFYGSHIHGEGLDPDEIKAIAGLATGAAAAYDHLDAEALRRENEAMKSRVESLETQLAEAQIQPA